MGHSIEKYEKIPYTSGIFFEPLASKSENHCRNSTVKRLFHSMNPKKSSA